MTLFYLGLPSCGQCNALKPRVKEWCRVSGVKFDYLDADENEALVTEYGIRSIPAMLLFRDGKLVRKIIGINAWNDFEKGTL